MLVQGWFNDIRQMATYKSAVNHRGSLAVRDGPSASLEKMQPLAQSTHCVMGDTIMLDDNHSDNKAKVIEFYIFSLRD